jgi:hypothetical protein
MTKQAPKESTGGISPNADIPLLFHRLGRIAA